MLSRQVYWSWTRSASISLDKVGRTSNTSSSDWFGSMCSWGVQACQNGRKAHFCITQWYKEQRLNTESVVMVSRWEWYHQQSVRRFRWPQIDHICTRVVCTDLQSCGFSNHPDQKTWQLCNAWTVFHRWRYNGLIIIIIIITQKLLVDKMV